jgi:hypothetical protein
MAGENVADQVRQMRVFISYSRKDGAFSERLRDALLACAFESYLDKHDIAPREPVAPAVGLGVPVVWINRLDARAA